jgi:chromate reductase
VQDVICISGSLRKASYNTMLARSLPSLAPAGMSIEAAPSFAGFPLYNADIQDHGFPADVMAFGDRIRRAHAVVIVTPEYNFSVPGVLKNAIDWVSRISNQPFANKPILIQSVSQGPLGGARAQYHLRQMMIFLEANVFNRPEGMVGSAKGKFDETQGELIDEPTRQLVRQQLASFQQFARHMTSGQ